MKFNDAVSGLFFILFALLLFYLTRDYPEMPGQSYGPDMFPRLIAVLMGVGGVLLVVKGLKEWSSTPLLELAEWTRSPRHVGNFLAVLAGLVAYILLSDTLGFFLTGAVVLGGLTIWLRGREHWKSSLLIAVVTVVAMHLFFGQFLRVPLPWGVFEDYAW
ncbi:tripartite tricarboxylate transporter TctB family protein [Actibacterium sp. MT2.3-13A]|uniref:tripartite tricarboxylate transporter TctB family protein n=1 Tax=Actibacterium sp. MT2.3-13A TaxID=2828332 RepID=UPI001BA55162|nr:tripartite tricarboxylate transporter TctB family protein [Actibacterium sp. MT2.3-13A]